MESAIKLTKDGRARKQSLFLHVSRARTHIHTHTKWECSVSNSKEWLDFGAYIYNFVGKREGEKRLPWEEQINLFRKDKRVFRRTDVR